jgi:hypothetical protein
VWREVLAEVMVLGLEEGKVVAREVALGQVVESG